jgi:hypothetical protein
MNHGESEHLASRTSTEADIGRHVEQATRLPQYSVEYRWRQ